MEKEIPRAPYHFSEGPMFIPFCRYLAKEITKAWQSGQLYRGDDGKVHWKEENQ